MAEVAGLSVRELGDYIREQRRTAQVSLRQLARLAGVSNPYLSQIERGLRRPSAEILQQIARALRISAETLYVQAGILDERAGGDVVAAIEADQVLAERQKRVLLDIYRSFLAENAEHGAASTGSSTGTENANGSGADSTANGHGAAARNAAEAGAGREATDAVTTLTEEEEERGHAIDFSPA